MPPSVRTVNITCKCMRPAEIIFPEAAQIFVNLTFRRGKHALKDYARVPDEACDKIGVILFPRRVWHVCIPRRKKIATRVISALVSLVL